MVTTIEKIKAEDFLTTLQNEFKVAPHQELKITFEVITPEPEPLQIKETVASFKPAEKTGKGRLDFIYSGFWTEQEGETDIAENHDHYLYDIDPHND